MARYGMLECGKNYKGSKSEVCDHCNILDDGCHRLNYCKKYEETNNFSKTEKVDFSLIYSTDMAILKPIITEIARVWNAQGTMRIND